MNRVEKTVDLTKNEGLNCAQALLTAFGDQIGVDPDRARLLGRAWGGGMGHRAEACGYLTGAVLVLAHARDDRDERRARADTVEAVRELFRCFEKKHGTSQCKSLLGADMSTAEGAERIKAEQLVDRHCYGYGREVAEILERLLSPPRP